MATNVELIAVIAALSLSLGIITETDGLTNAQMSALASELRAQVAALPAQPLRVFVADGKSITSKRGILSPGDVVTATHFAGGEESMRHLVARGYCVERE